MLFFAIALLRMLVAEVFLEETLGRVGVVLDVWFWCESEGAGGDLWDGKRWIPFFGECAEWTVDAYVR